MGLWRRTPRPGYVRLAIGEHLNPVIDELAVSYAADPVAVGRLLRGLADAVITLDAAVVDPHAADWQRAMAAEAVDAVRGALLGESLTAEGAMDMDLTPDQAERLAADLTREAAAQRRGSKENNR